MTDDLGRTYRLQPVTWGDSPGEPGRRRWRGEVLAEPQPAGSATGRAVRWLEFAGAESQPVRVDLPAPAAAETGPAEPAWPTPAEAYLAELASARSVTIATGEESVELDVAKIVAAVADALLWTGALPPDSAVLGRAAGAPAGRRSWRSCGPGRRTCGRATTSPNGPGWPLPCRCDAPPR